MISRSDRVFPLDVKREMREESDSRRERGSESDRVGATSGEFVGTYVKYILPEYRRANSPL